ncbi:Ubiquitin modifier-activating enzyme 1 [Pelomyxa schiedti]|nr:Ubiquitin modifier-activating enzyme 1 [Pelomyxa schiedti]
MGVDRVSISDSSLVSPTDIGSQLFLSAKDIGQVTAEAVRPHLTELSEFVQVAVEPSISPRIIECHDIVLFTGYSFNTACELDILCRNHHTTFLWVTSLGGFGFIFNDFGTSFCVQNGGKPLCSSPVVSLHDCIVTTSSDLFPDTFRGYFEGAGDLTFNKETKQPLFSFCRVGTCTYKVGEISSSVSISTGTLILWRDSCVLNASPLTELISGAPESKIKVHAPYLQDTYFQCHLALLSACMWFDKHSTLPEPGNTIHEQELLNIYRHLNYNTHENLDLVSLIATTCGCSFPPIISFIGGVLCHEVIKIISHRLNPIDQWLLFNFSEIISTKRVPLTDRVPTRYRAQAALIGEDLHDALRKSNILLAGAGAIGCEVIKNLSLLGAATERNGHLHVVDMDSIENSNLSRQFLFRPTDIGLPKSQVAVKAALKINPEINATAYNMMLQRSDVFTYEFFSSIDVIISALDSMSARRYLDLQSKIHSKPFVDGGTIGPEGNVQVAVPHITESFGAGNHGTDGNTSSIPLCTLKFFPVEMKDTLQWARDQFEALFIKNKESDMGIPTTFSHCVDWSCKIFHKLFHDDVKHVLVLYPPSEDPATETFWVPPRRKPQPIEYDSTKSLHASFVQSASNIRAKNFNITATQSASDLSAALPADFLPAKFDKDDDSLYHMPFVYAAAVIRANNYGIDPIDFHSSRRIIGNIIPALISTTAAIAGLQCIELVKLASANLSIEQLRSSFLNLDDIEAWNFVEPFPPASDGAWTEWDHLELPPGITLQETIRHYEGKYQTTVEAILFNDIVVFLRLGSTLDLNKSMQFHLSKLPGVLPEHHNFFRLEVIGTEDTPSLPPLHIHW